MKCPKCGYESVPSGGREYREFVLVADDVEKDEAGLVRQFTLSVFDSPVGQGEKKERATIPAKLTDAVRRLEKRGLDDNINRQMELGTNLANLLLPPYARQLFGESLARLRDGEGLRLRLRLADELADFPWEYMHVQQSHGEPTPNDFLALDPRLSIVRHEAVATPGDWFEAPGQRRVVVAMATPEPHSQYRKLANLPLEQTQIKTALDQVAGIRAVYLPDYDGIEGDEIPGATVKDLIGAFMERTDIFHFGGHGEFSANLGPAFGSKTGEGALVLANAQNQALPVSANRLADVLRGKGVRLVVLGACETGRRDGQNVWSSVVASLLKVGIPAVVAMQFTIKDNLAAAFSAAFYRALVAGFSVDEAVSVGRAAIRAEALGGLEDIRDWGVPVLYLRAPGGQVFNPVGDAEARQKAQEKVGNLVQQQVREVAEKGRVIGAVADTLKGAVITVDQTVEERVKGVMVGGYAVNLESGRLIVRQKADVVEGTMVGTVIKGVGRPRRELSEEQAMSDLEEYLRWSGSAASARSALAARTPSSPRRERTT